MKIRQLLNILNSFIYDTPVIMTNVAKVITELFLNGTKHLSKCIFIHDSALNSCILMGPLHH